MICIENLQSPCKIELTLATPCWHQTRYYIYVVCEGGGRGVCVCVCGWGVGAVRRSDWVPLLSANFLFIIPGYVWTISIHPVGFSSCGDMLKLVKAPRGPLHDKDLSRYSDTLHKMKTVYNSISLLFFMCCLISWAIYILDMDSCITKSPFTHCDILSNFTGSAHELNPQHLLLH